MGRPVVHFEIGVEDPERAERFYGELFDWKMQEAAGGYRLVTTDGEVGIGGGLMPTQEHMPTYVSVYVLVEDLEAMLARVEELGGKTLVDPMPIEGIGRFAMFSDLDGNTIGLLTQG
ncbi:MAG TPA: VOC family protein [Actinomycetota bacterium]|jgi:predicted enzyme related to lactoylglutathione lyase|nr:VOC family protein [Actinomycetota bacterium]